MKEKVPIIISDNFIKLALGVGVFIVLILGSLYFFFLNNTDTSNLDVKLEQEGSQNILGEENDFLYRGQQENIVSFPVSSTTNLSPTPTFTNSPTQTPSSTPVPTVKPTPTNTPTPVPTKTASSCPQTTQNCVLCNTGEQYCRTMPGESNGYKGWACQNNNPGNIRYSSYRNSIITKNGGTASCGDRGGYMAFSTYNQGRDALKAYIIGISKGDHVAYTECGECSLRYFFSKYAPAGDQNDPESYANKVATWIGVDVDDTSLNWIVANKLDEMVDAIQRMEGWFVE